jgi:Predicted GTPase
MSDAYDALKFRRQLFLGRCDFVQGVVPLDGLPPTDRPEICVAGRSNVGKSTRINAIAGRKALARSPNTPGRAQELNFFYLGGRLYMVDLLGLPLLRVVKGEGLGVVGAATAPISPVALPPRRLRADRHPSRDLARSHEEIWALSTSSVGSL